LKKLFGQGNVFVVDWQMKRLISIISSLLVFFAGVTAALAGCDKISFAAADQRHASVSPTAHDHHSDSHHEHSDNAKVHCPTVKEFVPTAVFSAKADRGQEHVVNPFAAVLALRMSYGALDCRLIHGPPAFAHSSGIPSHLFLSVLRI
jgi:hypothetical protein